MRSSQTPADSLSISRIVISVNRAVVRFFQSQRKFVASYALGAALFLGASLAPAHAAHVDIVALGESNTGGWGVGVAAAYPAVLEKLLRERGYDVSVSNQGVAGDTSAMVLDRVDSAVPVGTKVVILQMGYYNDSLRGVSWAENQAHIRAAIARVRARGAKVIFVDSAMFARIPRSLYQGDGLHLDTQGQVMMATRLLPEVMRAIRSR